MIRPDRHHHRQPDRRTQRVPPTHPVPELEHVARIDPELAHRLRVRRHRHKVPRHRRRIPQRRQAPRPRRTRIRHRLFRREGLRRHNEQRLRRIQPPHALRKVCAIHIGNKAHRQVALAVRLQRFVRHRRPQIGTTNPDVHHVAHALARVPRPRAASHPARKARHLLQHPVHVRHHVAPIHHDRRVRPVAQRHVQHRPPFRPVDLLPRHHPAHRRRQPARLRQLHQQPQRLRCHPVLRVIQRQPRRLHPHPLRTPHIRSEQLPQVHPPHRIPMTHQRLPLRHLIPHRLHLCRHRSSSLGVPRAAAHTALSRTRTCTAFPPPRNPYSNGPEIRCAYPQRFTLPAWGNLLWVGRTLRVSRSWHRPRFADAPRAAKVAVFLHAMNGGPTSVSAAPARPRHPLEGRPPCRPRVRNRPTHTARGARPTFASIRVHSRFPFLRLPSRALCLQPARLLLSFSA